MTGKREAGKRALYYEAITKLHKKEFEKHYLGLIDNYLAMNPEPPKKCNGCLKQIRHKEDLRLYHGGLFHGRCFRTRWERDRREYMTPELKTMRKYFDRVSALEIKMK